MNNTEWWKGAVIYQIYPRSFNDSNGDGIGDLQGIIYKLNYIASLGVNAIWISPFYQSPMKDFGYDISDYRAIDGIFGNMDDFDALILKAHALGLKVIIDQVPNHTSDQHIWFQESRQDKNNEKSDWYVWADAKADGATPNNWLSVFGGSAWQWDDRREQYYFHNFLTSQPDLNYHQPAVQQQILQEMAFWLDRGVDGLRLDAINFCTHDPQLRDNPIKPESERKAHGFSKNNPYAAQYHCYDNTQPGNIQFIEAIRKLLNQFPGTIALGEINSDNSLKTISEYTQGDERLHMGYSFDLLSDEFSATHIRQTVEKLEKEIQGSWPCWAISNHDVKRVVSRWAHSHCEEHRPDFAKVLSMMVCSLRGGICTYQGEELGLNDVQIKKEEIQDPYGLEFWPEFKGRDGCRTPMPWKANSLYADFSCENPWLPIPDEHRNKAVDQQHENANSVLNNYRLFLHWRKSQKTITQGDITFIDTPEPILAFIRHFQGESIIAYFNLSEKEQFIDMPEACRPNLQPIDEPFSLGKYRYGEMHLPAFSAFFCKR